MNTVTCPACGTPIYVNHAGGDTLIVASNHATDVEPADDGSGWFVTCYSGYHADPERFAVTREDVHA